MKRKHDHEHLPRAVWPRRSHAATLVSPRAPSALAALPSVLARLGADEGAGMFTYHTTRNGASSTERIMFVCSGRWRQRCSVWMHRIVVACSVSVCASCNPGPCLWPGGLDRHAGSHWQRSEDEEGEEKKGGSKFQRARKSETQRVRERTPASPALARVYTEDLSLNMLPLKFHTTRNGMGKQCIKKRSAHIYLSSFFSDTLF
jgi:hypothetical protein